MSRERDAFLKAIAADRYDAETRLVFADWLEEHGHDDEAAEQRRCATPEWREAARKVESLAGEIAQDYDSMMAAAQLWVETAKDDPHGWGEHTYDNSENYKGMGEDFWRTFWENYEVVKGTKVKDHEAMFFTCSC